MRKQLKNNSLKFLVPDPGRRQLCRKTGVILNSIGSQSCKNGDKRFNRASQVAALSPRRLGQQAPQGVNQAIFFGLGAQRLGTSAVLHCRGSCPQMSFDPGKKYLLVKRFEYVVIRARLKAADHRQLIAFAR